METDESLTKRRTIRRAHAHIKLTEGALLRLRWPDFHGQSDRQLFSGSNKSDVIGAVCTEPWSDVPSKPKSEKLLFWGDRRKAAGGRNPGPEPDNDMANANDSTDTEDEDIANQDGTLPVSFHTLRVPCAMPLIHNILSKPSGSLRASQVGAHWACPPQARAR